MSRGSEAPGTRTLFRPLPTVKDIENLSRALLCWHSIELSNLQTLRRFLCLPPFIVTAPVFRIQPPRCNEESRIINFGLQTTSNGLCVITYS